MIYIALAIIATFLFCIAHVIEANLATKRFKSPATLIFYLSVLKIVVSSSLFFTGNVTLPPIEVLLLCFLWGAVDVSYLFPIYKSYKLTDTSIVGALGAMGKIPIPLFSFIFLREVLELHQYLGFFVIILSSILLSIKNFKMPRINEAFFLVLFGSTIVTLTTVFGKMALNIDNNWWNLVVYANIFSSLIAFSLYSIPKFKNDIKEHLGDFKRSWKIISLNEVVCAIGHIFNFWSLCHLTVLARVSISGISPFLTMLIGLFLGKIKKQGYNESIDRKSMVKKSICFLFIIFGIFLTIKF